MKEFDAKIRITLQGEDIEPYETKGFYEEHLESNLMDLLMNHRKDLGAFNSEILEFKEILPMQKYAEKAISVLEDGTTLSVSLEHLSDKKIQLGCYDKRSKDTYRVEIICDSRDRMLIYLDGRLFYTNEDWAWLSQNLLDLLTFM